MITYRKIKQLLGLLLFAPVCVLAQSTDQNYVKTETVLNSSGGSMKSVQYYNGLGYPTLSVATTGVYGEGDALGSNTNRYSESLSYDANGNIISLKRYGKTSSGYGVMDNLSIAYTGNQPTSVSESASDNNASGAMEYKKANGSGYKFNANGSLVADKSRGIAYITYDLNNSPKQIYFTNGSVTKYVYSVSGQKLRAVHYTAKPNITRTWGVKPAELTMAQILQADSTDYLLGGRLTMKNGKVDKYLFDGGYAQASATSTTSDNFTFYYYTPDHLGNVREVVDAGGNVQQVTNYYPFGTTYADAATNPDFQPYKYNGKELDKMHGLNTYDYGARQHDPILTRWDRIDPLCEKYYNVSPYVYCKDNPIKLIDPDGNVVIPVHGTWSSPSTWKDIEGILNATNNLFGDNTTGESFMWTGGNNAQERSNAARQLIEHVRSELNNFDSSEPITLVGHSHGGNVCIEAINTMIGMNEFKDRTFNLLTINTPVRDDYQLSQNAQKKVNHVNVYDEKDPVQANGGKTTVGRFSVEIGKAGRTFKNARNIKVDNPQGVINYRRANNTNQIPGMTYCNPIEIESVGDYHNSHNRVQDWIKYTRK